ncbi:hypothetical protein LOK49_Contig193G00004 [Camellia lanceoleosa]|nr:hypothetical protein LOK49_Contig193G00004 [Camellia lanceoleosa]
MVATTACRREQIFVPESDFGGGWKGVALVLEGFAFGDGWARTKNKQPRVEVEAVGRPTQMIVPEHRDADVGDVVVQVGSEGGWFRKLDKAVVGRVGLLGEKGLDASVVANWVLRWWKSSGEVEVFGIGGQFYLFVFRSRREAESVLRRWWTIARDDLVLSWWSPDSLCADGGAPVSVSNNWVPILGLPIHLRSPELFREIGNRCGGFVAIDESVEILGCVLLQVHGQASGYPSQISIRWGSRCYTLPIWSETGPVVVAMPALGGPTVTDRPVMEGVNHGRKVWQGFWRIAQLQRLGELRGSCLNPHRFGNFRAVGQWKPGPTRFWKFRANGQWGQPQAQQGMGYQRLGHLDRQPFNQAQFEAIIDDEPIGLHDNGCGLGESSVDRVFDPSLGPYSHESPGQLTGQVEDLLVARVFELLRRSVGLPSSEGSSLVRKDRWQSLLCSPTLSPGLSQCQPQFNSEEGGDKARPFAEPSPMLVLRSEGYEQEGAGLGCHVDFSTGLEGNL